MSEYPPFDMKRLMEDCQLNTSILQEEFLRYGGTKENVFLDLFRDIDVSPVRACGEFFLFSGKIWWHFQHQSHGYFIAGLATCCLYQREKSTDLDLNTNLYTGY